jgi:ribosome-associated toxin RatA of RatAB toxin-antitoxin module
MNTLTPRNSFAFQPVPLDRPMVVFNERHVRAPVREIFALARDVEHWPAHLPHYRSVRFRERTPDGGGLVEMSAWRPFGLFRWPVWWVSAMQVNDARPAIRFRHTGGITIRMDVEWTFEPDGDGTKVRIVHSWNGPPWPVIGPTVAATIIGPVFVHAIAGRTLAGLAKVAERGKSGRATKG